MKEILSSVIMSLIIISCNQTPTETKKEESSTIPQINILSPSDNANILDSLWIEVDATDEKGVVKVEIYIDSKTDSLKTLLIKPYKYLWLTPQVNDSSQHSIFAKVYDTDGNVNSSKLITVNVYKFLSPTNLQCTAITDSTVTLQWQNRSSIASKVFIEKSVNPISGFSIVDSVSAQLATKIILGKYNVDTMYYFRVYSTLGNKKTIPTASVSKQISMLDQIIGQWVAEGLNVPYGLRVPPFKVKKITSTFNSNKTYTMIQIDSSNVIMTFTGNINTTVSAYIDTASVSFTKGAKINIIVTNQVTPTVVTLTGIFAISGTNMTYEAIQSSPSLGVNPPTPAGGFGSTSVGATKYPIYVVKYVKQ